MMADVICKYIAQTNMQPQTRVPVPQWAPKSPSAQIAKLFSGYLNLASCIKFPPND
jgi:hypothetical protein